MRERYGYQSYRGRVSPRRVLVVLVIVLAVVLAAVVALYLYLQRYVVYTDEGARFELPFDLPFLSGESAPPQESGGVSIVVEPSPAPSEAAPEEPEALRAVWIPLSAVTDGTAAALVEAEGGTAAVLDMKGEDGRLNYVSSLDLARRAGANPEGDDPNAALRAFNGGELYTVARLCCFQDDLLRTVDREMNILTNSGYLWYDEAGRYWTSPANGEVRAYLTGVAAELAGLGFDEILLDFAGYPTAGQLGWIRVGESYPAGELDRWIGQFYQEMAQALEPYDVTLSVRTTQAALTGAEERSGQTAENLAAWADRVWAEPPEGTETDYAALLSAAGGEDVQVVLIGPAEAGAEDSWALLP